MSSNSVRPLPDPEISLRDSRDFILGSPLARRALCAALPNFTIFLQDLLEVVHRLVQSCHLPEFTDHGLPHLCSLVDRVSRWELPPDDEGKVHVLPEAIEPIEAATLLLALLVHDLGMLSQNPADLPDNAPPQKGKGLWPDVASWVRHTHVDRLEKLLRRVMQLGDHRDLLSHSMFPDALDVAKSHQVWPWEWNGNWTKNARLRGIAAVVAVADLLDEDSARCDTKTLLEHREGNVTNRAHWLRHVLTENRVLVVQGRIAVTMVRPPGTSKAIRPLYSALRNHFKLVLLYENSLALIGANITNVEFQPCTNLPDQEALSLTNWQQFDGFGTEDGLCYQLLRTFMAFALKDNARIDAQSAQWLKSIALEDVDLSVLDRCRGTEEPRTELEQAFLALCGGSG
jgi:hypothetical protein